MDAFITGNRRGLAAPSEAALKPATEQPACKAGWLEEKRERESANCATTRQDSLVARVEIDEEKRFATLRARLALAGYALYRAFGAASGRRA